MKEGIFLFKFICFLRFAFLILFANSVSVLHAGTLPFFYSDIAISSKGEVVITEKGMKRIRFFSIDGKQELRTISLDESPTGLALDETHLYVTTFDNIGKLHIIELKSGVIKKTIVTGSGACSPLLDLSKSRLYVCNQYQNTISEIDLNSRCLSRTVKVQREPKSVLLSRDGKYLFSTNYLPAQQANIDEVAACVSVIGVDDFTKIKDIKLANGSNALRGMCLSPDGRYIYVTHNLGRFTVPTSQLQQGWMNTSAFSIIDVARQEYLGTVIVDEPERGAAGIWGISCNENFLFITHSGTHEISVIDQKAMLDKFLAYPNKKMLDYDLRFLYGLRKRIPLKGNGPREMVLTNNNLFIPTYFSDILNIVDTKTFDVVSVEQNPTREENSENKGERLFNDASRCFQNWQSCNGCHPDARTDGMNWDLLNDGVGNSKNCKSLLFSHVTPPNMISGIRAHAEMAVRAGFKYIQFFNISEEDAVCVDAYLKGLKPIPSPYLVNGELSKLAQEGRKVFEKMKCGECHSGILYTDMKMHRIGEDVEFENGWDTPTLREVWHTAPYLFDGRAATLEEVFLVHKHGVSKKVSAKEIKALTEYINSL